VAYIQALCKTLIDRTTRGDPLPTAPAVVLAENKWRAARYGLRGTMLDCIAQPEYAGQRVARTVELIGDSVEMIAPAAEELGAHAELAHLRTMLSDGYRTGAERQLDAYARRHNLGDVLRLLHRETLHNIKTERALPMARKSLFRWRRERAAG
jgi:carboxylate-amine ligase